eukprot:351660-Chlamydomonas_euryale.AAC.3
MPHVRTCSTTCAALVTTQPQHKPHAWTHINLPPYYTHTYTIYIGNFSTSPSRSTTSDWHLPGIYIAPSMSTPPALAYARISLSTAYSLQEDGSATNRAASHASRQH